MLFSCEADRAAAEDTGTENLMTEYSENLSIVMSENGRKSYHFETPLLEGYGQARDPYREFRKGIKITMFEKDSTAAESAVLTSNYAINYGNRRLWEAKGDVVVIDDNFGVRITEIVQKPGIELPEEEIGFFRPENSTFI